MDNYHALLAGISALENENERIIKMVEHHTCGVPFDIVLKVPRLMKKEKILIEVVLRNRKAINALNKLL